jgi:hypothetical protein
MVNIFKLKDDKFYVIDWEWTQRNSLPLWDLWTWAFWKNLSGNEKLNKKKLLRQAHKISSKLGGYILEETIIKNLFDLYLLQLYVTLEEFGHKDDRTTKTEQNLLTLLLER